jgi:transposase
MNIRYRVTLSAEERTQLRDFVAGGAGQVRRFKRAQILLCADAGISDETTAATVSVGTSTVYRTKRRFVEEGLERALSEDPRPGVERKLSATEEAMLIATACTTPPKGRARWTLELLADEMVRLTKHDRVQPAPDRGSTGIGRRDLLGA